MACASVLDEFKEIAECPICQNSVTEARQLPCLHAFCTTCLGKLIEDTKTQACATMSCPVCSYIVEELNIESFPLANFLNNFSKTLNKVLFLNEELCAVCKQKEVETVGSHACLDCAKVMCDNCLFFHNQFQSGHNIHSINNIDRNIIEEFLKERKDVCKKHEKRDLEYCCKDCMQLLCVTCFVDSHKEHKVDKVDAASKTYKTQLQEVVNGLNSELSRCMKTTEETKGAAELLVAAHKNCRENIQRHARAAKLQIDKTEAKLLEDIDRKEHGLTKQLQTKTENIKSTQKKIKQAIIYLTLLQRNGRNTEICQTMITEKERLKTAANDTNGDRHKVPVLNLHLDDCGEMFKIPAFLLVDKISEFVLPYKPGGIVVDKNGRIVVCEYAGVRAFVFDTNGDKYLGLKLHQNAKLVDIACNDVIYILAETSNTGLVHAIDFFGNVRNTIRMGPFEKTKDIGLDVCDDVLYVTSQAKIFTANLTGAKISTTRNHFLHTLNRPFFIAAARSHVVVSYQDINSIIAYDKSSKKLFTYGTGKAGSGDGELNRPWGVAVDKQGCTFISDSNNKRVVVLSPSGKLLGYVGYCDGLYESTYPLAVTEDGKLLVGWGNMDGEGPWKVTTFSYTVVGPMD